MTTILWAKENLVGTKVPETPPRLYWNVSTGEMFEGGELIGRGYSGKKGLPRNNPDWEGLQDMGPIPRGRYLIAKARFSNKTGPVALDLTPHGHDALGRSGFQIHGDNKLNDASSGCIILPRPVREHLAFMRKFYGPKLVLAVV